MPDTGFRRDGLSIAVPNRPAPSIAALVEVTVCFPRNGRKMAEISRYCIPYTPFSGKLENSRIGLVSTAGVHLKTQPPFVLAGDNTVRMIPADALPEQLSISHEHYDYSDASLDINCVFPLEILRELMAEGRIGSTTQEHICMGFSQAMREIREKTSVEIASVVRRSKADAVLLTAG